MRLWKVLDANGRACHGGTFDYTPYLPKWSPTNGWVPGKWTPRIENPVACQFGYHACRDQDLVRWLNARIWACEGRGIVVADNKVVCESIRLIAPTPWDDVAARLFAVECAADVLPLFESAMPGDSRVADCLEVATRYALGDATDDELVAARAAAWAAAGAAAWAAAWAAQTERLLWWLGAEWEGR